MHCFENNPFFFKQIKMNDSVPLSSETKQQ